MMDDTGQQIEKLSIYQQHVQQSEKRRQSQRQSIDQTPRNEGIQLIYAIQNDLQQLKREFNPGDQIYSPEFNYNFVNDKPAVSDFQQDIQKFQLLKNAHNDKLQRDQYPIIQTQSNFQNSISYMKRYSQQFNKSDIEKQQQIQQLMELYQNNKRPIGQIIRKNPNSNDSNVGKIIRNI